MPVKAKERVAEAPKVAAEDYLRRIGFFNSLFGGAYNAYLGDDFPDLPEGEDGGGEGGGRCP